MRSSGSCGHPDDDERMQCTRRKDVGRLLDGTLSPSGVRDAFSHLRACEFCRDELETGRRHRLELRKRLGADEDAAEPAPEGPRFQRMGLFGRMVMPASQDASATGAARPGRRRNMTLLFLTLTVAAIAFLTRQSGDAEDSPDTAAARSLAQGRAVLLSPTGLHDGRPRIASVLIGAPVASARLMVFGPDGATAATAEVSPGRDGAALLPARLETARGPVDAWRLVANFPDDVALPLVPGAAYGVCFVLPGGQIASGLPFTLK